MNSVHGALLQNNRLNLDAYFSNSLLEINDVGYRDVDLRCSIKTRRPGGGATIKRIVD